MFFVQSKYLNKFLWLWILIIVVVSFIFPYLGGFVRPYLIYLLMCLMFLSSLNIKFGKIIKDLTNFEKVRSTLFYLMIIHILTPILVIIFKPYIFVEHYVGFVLTAVTSSGVAIVFLSDLYGGKPRRALELTTISNLLNVIAIPALVLAFAGQYIKVDFLSILYTVIKLVIIPLILAEIVIKVKLDKKIAKVSSPLSILLLLLIMYGTVAPTRDYILENLSTSIKIFGIAIIMIITMFLIGYSTAETKKGKITYGIASSFKNFTLSTVIALTLFDEKVALVPIVYTVASNLLLAPAYLIFAKK